MKYRPPTILELPQDELGGASGARRFYVLTVGKRNTAEYPYSVSNEKIASEMGRIIGLRIPEVVLHRVKEDWYAYSNYVPETDSGETAPEGTAAEIAEFYEDRPSELHGMICFDLFICNNDRKPDNFVVAESDKKVWLIDHANALFYRPTGKVKAGIPRLASVGRDLKEMFDKPYGFMEGMTSWQHIEAWCRRIAEIPSYFINATIDKIPAELLTNEEREFLFDFLDKRKSMMKRIIESHASLFPALKPQGEEDDE